MLFKTVHNICTAPSLLYIVRQPSNAKLATVKIQYSSIAVFCEIVTFNYYCKTHVL